MAASRVETRRISQIPVEKVKKWTVDDDLNKLAIEQLDAIAERNALAALDPVSRDRVTVPVREKLEKAIDAREVTYVEGVVKARIDFWGQKEVWDFNKSLDALSAERHGGRRVPFLLNLNGQRSWRGTVDANIPSRSWATFTRYTDAVPPGGALPAVPPPPPPEPSFPSHCVVSMPSVPRGLPQQPALFWLVRVFETIYEAAEKADTPGGLPVIVEIGGRDRVQLSDFRVPPSFSLPRPFLVEFRHGDLPRSERFEIPSVLAHAF